MPETMSPPEVRTEIAADIDRVCLLVPPLWELDGFVAVNPFLGFGSVPVDEAARAMADAMDAQVLPPMSHFRRLWRQGEFDGADLDRAAEVIGIGAVHLQAMLSGEAAIPMRLRESVLTQAEQIDRKEGTEWEAHLREHAATWCAVFASRRRDGLAVDAGLFEGWLADAAMDRSLELAGLAGFRRWVAGLPVDPVQAIERMVVRLGVPAWQRQAYLYRLLAGVHGWASQARRWAWAIDRDDPGLVREILAVRVCLDAAVVELAPLANPCPGAEIRPVAVEDERIRFALQDALEDAKARTFAGRFLMPVRTSPARPALQAAFCIDVRSEVLRRHLEAACEGLETIGFAGFFGMAMRWHGRGGSGDRCPVLLRPSLHVLDQAPCAQHPPGSLPASVMRVPGASFPAVEMLGLGALATLLRRALRSVRRRPRPEEVLSLEGVLERSIDGATQVEMAAAILAGMSLHDRFARLFLLCGHQGRSENNPHAASLDCGACGGRGGALNARLAARLLNDASVRQGLRDRGVQLPADTRFVAGVHETSTDEITLLDVADVPASHAADLASLLQALERAGQATRRERARGMGLQLADQDLLKSLSARGGDWSQTRPEWGLARNAMFVAARRGRTSRSDLEGRAFLHDYDASRDADGSVLSLILSAPMVVASWINLQYFASTVDNRTFGSGDKMLHNRVGDLGVVAGNGSDLRSGLPLQSVQGPDGRWFHDPIRLQVFVEAGTSAIDRVLQSQPAVRDLVENGWVRLFALGPDGASVARRVPGIGWETFLGEASPSADGRRGGAGQPAPGLDLPEQPRPRAAAAGQGPRHPTA